MIASRLLARWSTSPSDDHRDAVAHPAAPACGRMPGDARSLGTLRRFESAVMPEVSGRGVPDLVHGGSDDLLVWPPSAVERQLAAEWCATGEPALRDDLYALTGSIPRAEAIAELVYLEQRARLADDHARPGVRPGTTRSEITAMIRRTAAATAVSAPFITSTSFEFACACAFLAGVSLLTAAFAQVMTS